jgi:hypothetical protein
MRMRAANFATVFVAQVAAATFTTAALRAALDGSFLESRPGPFLGSAKAYGTKATLSLVDEALHETEASAA